jgi:hypothetical protein
MAAPPAPLTTWARLRGLFTPPAAEPPALLRSSRGRRNSSGLLVHVDAHARTLSQQFNTRRWPRGPRDVYAVLFVLRQRLVADVLRDIVDAAEYWLKTSTIRSDRVVVVERTAGAPYVVSPAVEGNGRRPVRKVIFTITSHDQGWSDYGEHHGTYVHSWTWFEARVMGADGKERREGRDGVPVEPLKLVRNVHASEEARTHTVVVESKGGDEGAEWVRGLRAGEAIAVVPMAMYPGWANHVLSMLFDPFCWVDEG